MEYVIVAVLIYLLCLAGNWIKNRVMHYQAFNEVMEGMDDLGDEW